MDYTTLKYPQLKAECAKRGLGGAGTAIELLTKLSEDDHNESLDVADTPHFIPPPEPDATPKSPPFSNWDADGKWVRRPKDFISWADEKRKWEDKNGRNHDSPTL
jgi:hypothetical protein